MEKRIKMLAKKVIGRFAIKRFNAAFGVPIDCIPKIFELLYANDANSQLSHLLWTLHFLKTYPTEIIGSAAWGTDTKTWNKHIKNTIEQLLIVLPDYDWENRFDQSVLQHCSSIVDVTRVRIQKPKDNQRLFYSAKDKFHALKFEVVVTISNPRIIWVNGGIPGSIADITIAREELLGLLDEGEKILADLGYRGREDSLWTPFLNPQLPKQVEMNHEHNRIRQIVERLNQPLKVFDCLKSIWRHDHLFCTRCFNVIGRLTNLILERHPL
jgi:hypothetical protein